MVQTATFSKGSSTENYTAWMPTTTSDQEHFLREKSMQLVGLPTFTSSAYGTTTNASVNPTIAYQFIVLQRITNFEEYLLEVEDTSGMGASFVTLFDLSSLRETTETHIRTRYCFSGLLCGTLGYQDVYLSYGLVTPPESPWMSTQAIQEEKEWETIRADTNRALSFKDLVSALDRISRPTEMEDIPLPFDPDDYPVV